MRRLEERAGESGAPMASGASACTSTHARRWPSGEVSACPTVRSGSSVPKSASRATRVSSDCRHPHPAAEQALLHAAEDLVAEQRTAAEEAVKVDLALRAVAEAEGHEVNGEDLEQHFAELSRRFGVDAEEIRVNFERAGQMLAVRSDVKKAKALDWLLKQVEIVDEDGNVIDRASLELSADADDADTDAAEHDNPGAPGEDAE